MEGLKQTSKKDCMGSSPSSTPESQPQSTASCPAHRFPAVVHGFASVGGCLRRVIVGHRSHSPLHLFHLARHRDEAVCVRDAVAVFTSVFGGTKMLIVMNKWGIEGGTRTQQKHEDFREQKVQKLVKRISK